MSARDRWYPIVVDLERSREPIAVVARRHGVNANTLAWWRAEFRRGRAFAPIVVAEEPPSKLRLTVCGRVEIEVDQTFDANLLRRVVDALC